MKICNRKTFLFFLSLFLGFSDISAAKKWQILGLALLKILDRDRSRVWNFHYVSGNRRAECKLRIGKRDERVANYGKSLIRWGANFSIREGWSFRFGQSNRSRWNISIIIAIFVSIDSKIGLESLAPFKNGMKIDEGKEGKEAKLTIRYSFSNLDRYFLVRRTGLGFLLRMEYQTEQYRASTFFLHTACKITRNDTYTLAWKYEWNLSPRRLETRYRSICQGQPPRKRRGARRAGTASTTSCPLFSSRIRTAPAGACQQLGQQVDARSRGPRWLKVNGETRTCVPFRCGCRGMSRPPPPPRFSRRQSFSTIARLEQQFTTNSIAVTSSLYYRLSWAGFRNARVNLSLGERWEKRRIPLGKQRPTERQPAAAFAFQSDSTTGGLHRMRDHHHGSPTRSKRTPLAGRRESSSFQEFQSDHETTRTETVPRTMEFRKEEPRKKWIEVKGTFHRLFTNCATFNSQTLEFNTR